MVLDKIENYKLYEKISERLALGFKFLKETDLSQIESGKYTIEGENIFALVQEYNTKSRAEGKPESHFKYIDIQYIISGIECIGFTSLTDQIHVYKNLENDIAFYECNSTLLTLSEGMFAVFFPNDVHMPGIQSGEIAKVRKVVVKVLI